MHSIVFVGLGGAGCEVVGHIRASILGGAAARASTRAPAGFLGIDTAPGSPGSLLPAEAYADIGGGLDTDEYLERALSNQDLLEWWPTLPTVFLPHQQLSGGTGGVRLAGRLGLRHHFARDMHRLFGDVDSPGAVDLPVGASSGPGRPAVFVVASATGGTGSGILLDVAYLLKERTSAEIVAVLLGPGVSQRTMQARASATRRRQVVANGLATLSEIESWMHRDAPYAFTLEGHKINSAPLIDERGPAPFSRVFLVEAENQVGCQWPTRAHYVEMVATGLRALALGLEAHASCPSWQAHCARLQGLTPRHGRSRRYGSFGALRLEFPAARVLRYCALTWADERLSALSGAPEETASLRYDVMEFLDRCQIGVTSIRSLLAHLEQPWSSVAVKVAELERKQEKTAEHGLLKLWAEFDVAYFALVARFREKLRSRALAVRETLFGSGGAGIEAPGSHAGALGGRLGEELLRVLARSGLSGARAWVAELTRQVSLADRADGETVHAESRSRNAGPDMADLRGAVIAELSSVYSYLPPALNMKSVQRAWAALRQAANRKYTSDKRSISVPAILETYQAVIAWAAAVDSVLDALLTVTAPRVREALVDARAGLLPLAIAGPGHPEEAGTVTVGVCDAEPVVLDRIYRPAVMALERGEKLTSSPARRSEWLYGVDTVIGQLASRSALQGRRPAHIPSRTLEELAERLARDLENRGRSVFGSAIETITLERALIHETDWLLEDPARAANAGGPATLEDGSRSKRRARGLLAEKRLSGWLRAAAPSWVIDTPDEERPAPARVLIAGARRPDEPSEDSLENLLGGLEASTGLTVVRAPGAVSAWEAILWTGELGMALDEVASLKPFREAYLRRAAQFPPVHSDRRYLDVWREPFWPTSQTNEEEALRYLLLGMLLGVVRSGCELEGEHVLAVNAGEFDRGTSFGTTKLAALAFLEVNAPARAALVKRCLEGLRDFVEKHPRRELDLVEAYRSLLARLGEAAKRGVGAEFYGRAIAQLTADVRSFARAHRVALGRARNQPE